MFISGCTDSKITGNAIFSADKVSKAIEKPSVETCNTLFLSHLDKFGSGFMEFALVENVIQCYSNLGSMADDESTCNNAKTDFRTAASSNLKRLAPFAYYWCMGGLAGKQNDVQIINQVQRQSNSRIEESLLLGLITQGMSYAVDNYDECEKILEKSIYDRNAPYYICYLAEAIKTNNPKRCSYISRDYETLSENCYSYLAIKNEDVAICNKKSPCIFQYAIATGNKDVCKNENKKSACEALVDRYRGTE